MNKVRPSADQVSMYLERWDSLDNYVLQERSLRKLFTQTYPLNVDMDDVLIKVCSLNDFYSTNIFSPFNVAKHIAAILGEILFVGNFRVIYAHSRQTSCLPPRTLWFFLPSLAKNHKKTALNYPKIPKKTHRELLSILLN